MEVNRDYLSKSYFVVMRILKSWKCEWDVRKQSECADSSLGKTDFAENIQRSITEKNMGSRKNFILDVSKESIFEH